MPTNSVLKNKTQDLLELPRVEYCDLFSLSWSNRRLLEVREEILSPPAADYILQFLMNRRVGSGNKLQVESRTGGLLLYLR